MNKTIGILAHVDCGKTTFCEQLLYHTNAIRKRGRVDNKDTFLSYTVFASSTGVKYYGSTPKSLQYKEFYNFDNINNVTLTIKLSTDTKNKIDEKERNESCFGYENCTCDNEGVCSGYND